MYETLRYEEAGDVATITLKREQINMRMVRELTQVCDHLEDTSSCTVAVFQSDGKDFSRGIDLKEFRPDSPMDIHGFNKWEKMCVRIERLPKITIAALNGAVVGGGLQLALVCDARLATSSTTLQCNEVRQGFLPGMATFRLAKYVGLGHAKRLIMQCAAIDAQEACTLGLVDRVDENLDVILAETIANFQPVHPVAIEFARRLLNESFATTFEDAIGNFLAAQHRTITQTAFLQTLKQHHKKD